MSEISIKSEKTHPSLTCLLAKMVSTSDVYVAILLLFAQSVVASTTFGLNRDWRFLLSDVEPSSCSLPDPFPFDANNKCMGLQPALYASSPETCLDSCCADDSCEIWQWCDGTSGCGDVGCLIGKKTTCDDDQEGWVGGYRSTLPPPPTPSSTCNLTLTPECGEDFDDGAWRILDIPHDYVVEGKVDQEKGDMSHGYLPVGKAWYRKHFSTPQVSDQQELAYLQFEGIMGAIEVYCTSEVDTVGSLPSMTYVPDARLKATMKSASSNEDVAERCVNVEVFHEGRGSASYTLEEVRVVQAAKRRAEKACVSIIRSALSANSVAVSNVTSFTTFATPFARCRLRSLRTTNRNLGDLGLGSRRGGTASNWHCSGRVYRALRSAPCLSGIPCSTRFQLVEARVTTEIWILKGEAATVSNPGSLFPSRL